jgi:hypothetical protein
MAIKRKLTKAEYDALSESNKALYKVDPKKAEQYIVDLDGDDEPNDDAAALKRAKDRETENARLLREENAALKAEKAAKEKELAELGDVDAKKRGDIETLTKSWQKKLEATQAEGAAKLGKRDTFLTKTLRDNVALQLANDISTAPKLLLPHIAARLSVDLDGDEPRTVILDGDGKVSALNIDDLRKEFLANKDFASILTGSKGSGSGAAKPPVVKPGGAGAVDPNQKPPLLTSMQPKDLAAEVAARKAARMASQGG